MTGMRVLAFSLATATLLQAAPASGETVFTLGAGVGVGPDYEGAEDYGVGALPMIGVEWTDDDTTAEGPVEGTELQLGLHGAYFSLPEGVGIDFLKLRSGDHVLTGGVGLSYDFGRDAGDNDGLTGMGDIDGYAVGTIGLSYETNFGLFAGLGVHQSLSGDDRGATADLSLGYALPLSKTLLFLPSIYTVWASEDHMQSYFSVSGTQAAQSGNRRFDAGAGFKTVGLDAALQWSVSESWGVFTQAGYARLIGDAADSPLVADKGDPNQFSGMAGVSYRF